MKALARRKKPLVKRPWSKEDLLLLKNMARKEPPAKIAKSLKRTESATRQKAMSEGVSLRMSVKKRAPANRTIFDHLAHPTPKLARIKAAGMTMIWIEHVVHALLAIADRLVVLNFGLKLAEGESRAVMADAEVQRVYMGMEA